MAVKFYTHELIEPRRYKCISGAAIFRKDFASSIFSGVKVRNRNIPSFSCHTLQKV